MCAKRPTYEALAGRVTALEAELEATRNRLRECEGRGSQPDGIRKGETLYRFLVENLNDLVYAVDAGGTLTFCGPQVFRFGYTPDEVVGRGIAEFIHPDDVEQTLREFQHTITAGEEFSSYFRIVCKDGRAVDVEEFGHVVRDGGKVVGLVGVLRDFTARKRAEEAVVESRETERRFRRQLGALHAVAVELSMLGSFDELCRRAVELGRSELGFDRLGLWFLVGEPLLVRGSFGVDEEGSLRDERDERGPVNPNSLMGRVLARKEQLQFTEETDLRNPRGDVVGRGMHAIASLWDGKEVIGCICADNLLTGGPIPRNQCELLSLYASALGHLCSRQKAEAALRESERRYALAQRAAHIGSWEWDLRTRRGTWSEELERIAGLEPGAFGGTPEDLARRIHPDDVERATSAFAACAREGKGYNIEYRLVRADGAVRWVQDIGNVVRGDEGEPERTVGMCMDITDRKRAEEEILRLNAELERRVDVRTRELAESEARYRAIYEAIPEAVFLYDSERREVVHANDAFCQMYGYAPDDLKGRALEAYWPVHPEDRARIQEVSETLQTQPGPRRYPVHRRLRKDGLVFWADITTTDTELRGRALKLIITRDVTERRKAAAALRHSEQRYRTLAESARDSIFIVNPDMTVQYVNDFGAKQFRRTPEATIGTPLRRLFHPSSIEELEKHLTSVLQTGQPVSVERAVRFAHAPDREVWLDSQLTPLRNEAGEVEAVMGVARDTTRRRQAEEALRESEERYRRVVEDQTELICRFRPTGELTFVNGAYCRYFDKRPEELIGRSFMPLIPEEDRNKPKDCIAALSPDNPVGHVEHRVIGPDGGELPWLRWTNRLISDEHGNPAVYQAVGRDITREKQAESALRRTQREQAAILNSMTEHVIYHDKDMVIVWANRTACDSVGLTRQQIAGKTCYELWQGRSSPCDGCPVKKTLGTGQPHAQEMATPDGRQWLVRSSPVQDENGGLVGVVEITMDITERTRAEEALRDSEERYRAVFEQAADSIVLADIETAGLVEFNDSACRNLGYTRDEFSRLTLADIDVIESVEEVVAHLSKAVRQGHDTFETKQRRKDGDLRDVHVNTRVISVRGRDFVHSVWRDITEQNRAAEALRESELRYRTLFEASTDAIFLETLKGRILDCNASACRMYGYAKDGLCGLTVADIVPESIAATLPEVIAEHLTTGGLFVEALGVRKDGSQFPTEVSTRLATIGVEQLVVAYVRDITEQKRAREALRQSEERYRTIYEVIPDAVFLYDPATSKLVSANDVMLELYGYTSEEIKAGKVGLLDLVPEGERDRIREELAVSLDRPGPEQRGVRPSVKKDGTPVWADATTTPIEFGGHRLRLAILRDVTESVRAREQIDRQAMLLANVTDAVAVTGPDRAVTYWNRGAEESFGYAEDEMLGRTGFGLLLRDPGQEAEINQRIESAAKEQTVWSHARLPCRCKSGEEIWVNVRASALKPGPGEAEGVLFVARDVTRQVLLQQRLILTQRMAAIGTLALSVSHELNNMLGGLRGLADIATGNASMTPRLIDACRAVAERGGVIAGRMTSLSRADSPGQERQIDVASVARTVVSMMGPSLAPRHIGVAESYQAVPPTWINEGKILQVLLNLITNARDSVGSDGRVDMSVRHDADQNRIVISVHDSGAGIRAEDLPRVFDPFFTTKLGPGPDGEELSHLGLGLAESRTIVHDCGGTIDVESEPGQGATFTVRLPVRSVPTAPPRLSAAAQVMPERGTSILVVDDDKLMRFWLTEHLGDLGYNVVEAPTGQAAADACRDRAFPYVFLDLLMPGEMDGAATLRTLKEVQPDAKIIIITALTRANIPKDCLEAAHAVLKKPFGVDDLPAAFAGESSE